MKTSRRMAGKIIFLAVILFMVMTLPVFSAEADAMKTITTGLNTMWVLIAAFLVFFMQAGFGMVEAGFIRAKNATNILTKNFLDFCMASLGFFAFGYAIMFGTGDLFMGMKGFFLIDAANPSGVPLFAFWLFQAAFCGAAATIVAGGMAERMKFPAYLIYSFVISAFVYPVVGHWIWGGGFLSGGLGGILPGFQDYAGSTVVHLTGGAAALIGTIILRPRIGKYRKDGSANVMAGHSIPLAALGVFILWFGWFGFNPGSSLGIAGAGQALEVASVAINTNLAAASGGVAAMIMVWILFGKPDLSMAMNGALAGLVSITAPCASVEPWAAITIGFIGGIVVVLGVILLDKFHIDDPVGAVPVHGMGGLWGTIALGIFSVESGVLYNNGFGQLAIQIIGALSVAAFVIISMGIVFFVINKTIGLRVSREEEIRGLDIGEHGLESYGGFQIFN